LFVKLAALLSTVIIRAHSKTLRIFSAVSGHIITIQWLALDMVDEEPKNLIIITKSEVP
jgi:hypothetical protein